MTTLNLGMTATAQFRIFCFINPCLQTYRLKHTKLYFRAGIHNLILHNQVRSYNHHLQHKEYIYKKSLVLYDLLSTSLPSSGPMQATKVYITYYNIIFTFFFSFYGKGPLVCLKFELPSETTNLAEIW